MIVDFTIENFRSIKDELYISFEPFEEKGPNTFLTEYKDIPELFRVITILGTNNSGKSNIIKALSFFTRMIKHSLTYSKSTTLPAEPFFATEAVEINTETKFTIRVLANYNEKIALYTYSIAFTNENITFEKLTVKPNDDKEEEEELLYREQERDTIKIHEEITYSKERLNEELFNKILLLTFLYERTENTNIEKVFNEVRYNVLSSENRTDFAIQATNSWIEEEITKEEILQFLNDADLHIHDMQFKQVKLKVEDFRDNPEKIPKFRQKLIQEDKGEVTITEILISKQNSEGKVFQGYNLKRTESSGTQLYYGLAGIMIRVIRDGDFLAIDELSNSLHPILGRNIFKRFNSKVTNPKNAQLLFTTHSTEVLDIPNIIKDQVYLLSIDPDTLATKMESIAEYKGHEKKLSSQDYLQGYFGAIPSTILAPIGTQKEGK